PEDREKEASEFLEKVSAGNVVQNYETIRRHKNGSILNVSLTISPLIDENGQIIGLSTIARDITENKRARAELEGERIELKRLFEADPGIIFYKDRKKR